MQPQRQQHVGNDRTSRRRRRRHQRGGVCHDTDEHNITSSSSRHGSVRSSYYDNVDDGVDDGYDDRRSLSPEQAWVRAERTQYHHPVDDDDDDDSTNVITTRFTFGASNVSSSSSHHGGHNATTASWQVPVTDLRQTFFDALDASSRVNPMRARATITATAATATAATIAMTTTDDVGDSARTTVAVAKQSDDAGRLSRDSVDHRRRCSPSPRSRAASACAPSSSSSSLLSSACGDAHGVLLSAALGVCAGYAGKRAVRGALRSAMYGVIFVHVLSAAGYAHVRWTDLLRDVVLFVRPPRLVHVHGDDDEDDDNTSTTTTATKYTATAVVRKTMRAVRCMRSLVMATAARRWTFCASVLCSVLLC